jgi:hypothetical protein
MMTVNRVTVGDKTFERRGKAMSYAVAFVGGDGGSHVEWASTLELARKNADAHIRRWEAATAGESLRYPWSTDAYRRYTSIDIVQVDHA